MLPVTVGRRSTAHVSHASRLLVWSARSMGAKPAAHAVGRGGCRAPLRNCSTAHPRTALALSFHPARQLRADRGTRGARLISSASWGASGTYDAHVCGRAEPSRLPRASSPTRILSSRSCKGMLRWQGNTARRGGKSDGARGGPAWPIFAREPELGNASLPPAFRWFKTNGAGLSRRAGSIIALLRSPGSSRARSGAFTPLHACRPLSRGGWSGSGTILLHGGSFCLNNRP